MMRLVLISFISVLFAILIGPFKARGEPVTQGTLKIEVPLPKVSEYSFTHSPKGTRIEAHGLGFLNTPGEPMLPSKRFLLALPPGARASKIEVRGMAPQPIPGVFQIMPAPRVHALGDLTGNPVYDENLENQWHLNRARVYETDQPFPQEPGRLLASGTLRAHPYAAVSICPFVYHPRTGRLSCYRSAQVSIFYDLHSQERPASLTRDTIADERALTLFHNDLDSHHLYTPPPMKKKTIGGLGKTVPLNQWDYLILTADDLVNSIKASDFLAWKESLGFNVKIIKVSHSKITGQPGKDLAEQIRNFLRKKYISWGIRYVLLVGDYLSVPMRYCYPYPNNHTETGKYPTDYYYADLSFSDAMSWDADDDGFLGEYGQDYPDFLADVYVGRIPVNNPTRITYTLDKLVAFEQDTGAWKSQALHTGAIIYFTNEDHLQIPLVDGARFANEIEMQLMDGWPVSHYSEQEGLETSPLPWPALTEQDFATDWREGQWGVVNWFAHGLYPCDGAVRKIWSWDDGDGIPESAEFTYKLMISKNSDLDDDHPSIIFAISCSLGAPEPMPQHSFGIEVLTKPSFGASAGIVCSSRVPFLTPDWPAYPGGIESIGLEFNRFMIEDHKKVGEAFYDAMHYCHVNYGWPLCEEYCNMYTMNLFGDPSLTLKGIP